MAGMKRKKRQNKTETGVKVGKQEDLSLAAEVNSNVDMENKNSNHSPERSTKQDKTKRLLRVKSVVKTKNN